MLKLHAYERSPYGWKTRIVLAEKKVPFALVIPENKAESPEWGKLNPFRLSPVLELPDHRTVYESTVVNEFLEETYPDPPMLPKDPYERARVRMLEDTTDQYFMPAVRELVTSQFDSQPPLLVRKEVARVDTAAVEAALIKVHMHLARLDAELSGRTWFGGTIFSLADAALVPPILMTLPVIGMLPDARYPNLAVWAHRVSEKESYVESRPKEPTRVRE